MSEPLPSAEKDAILDVLHWALHQRREVSLNELAERIAKRLQTPPHGSAAADIDPLAGERAPDPSFVSRAGSEREVPAVSPARGHLASEFVYRHDDDSECLWSVTDQAWCHMHPLYPIEGCDRPHVLPPTESGATS